jgi:hypothetical protein
MKNPPMPCSQRIDGAHEKTAVGLHLGGSVFADSAPVSNGSEDKASPGC